MEGLDTQIVDARVGFVSRPFRRPLVLSTGAIRELTEARAEVVVRVSGREAVGAGSVYLSDLWAWPYPALTHAQRVGVLRR